MTGRIGATYRLQLGPDLSFTDVAERVDYLARLGIECLYCSPIAEAVPGSTHGYDVTDPTRLRAELGGDAGFSALGSAAAAAGLAVMIDIVPNHLSTSVDGPWWRDVLRLGEQSEFAEVFDIDWASGGGKVLVPLIDRPIDEAVKSNMVRIDDSEGGEPLVHVGEMTLPITAGTVRDGEDVLEVLAAQPYRLVDWHDRTQRNYRRFFDIDGLVGVRVERTEVFRRTHALVARLVEEGLVNSLRVDHIDGLADPGAYLQQLAELTGGIPVVVEKILTGDERLRSSWPVVGTTGYEVIDDIAGALIDPDGFDRLAGAAEAEGQRPVEVCTTTGRRIAAEGPFAVDIERAARRLGVDGRELAAVTARMPYYRTYLDGGPVHTDDAVALSMASIGEHAEAVAIREACADPDRLEGVLAWQQLTGAVMAKGVEDTAWYRLPGRLALCEVGGDPARPRGDAIERLHRRAASRATGVHGGLVPSTTHDTKHSGDARARLYVLSELAVGFEAALDRFRDLLNRELHASSTLGAEHSGAEHSGAEHSGAEHSGAESSTLGIEIVASESRLLAQTVLSVLPVEAHPEQYDDLCERVSQAMIKSTREAKLHSS